MGKQFDELAKSLASGVSRRVALKQFALGVVGTVGANAIWGRNASIVSPRADRPRECEPICREAGFEGRKFGECVSTCTNCLNNGGLYFSTNGSRLFCVPA